jgi:hypothetical protein
MCAALTRPDTRHPDQRSDRQKVLAKAAPSTHLRLDFRAPPDPARRTLGKPRTDVARIGSNWHVRPSDIKALAVAPLSADSPADPGFRPVWEPYRSRRSREP